MHMTLNRNHTLIHKSGLSVTFQKDKPTYIPPRMVADAVALGAEPNTSDVAEVAKTMQEVEATRAANAGRAKTIEDAVRKMLARNQRGDFTAGGRPNLRVLFQLTDLQVTQDELEPIWSTVVKDIE